MRSSHVFVAGEDRPAREPAASAACARAVPPLSSGPEAIPESRLRRFTIPRRWPRALWGILLLGCVLLAPLLAPVVASWWPAPPPPPYVPIPRSPSTIDGPLPRIPPRPQMDPPSPRPLAPDLPPRPVERAAPHPAEPARAIRCHAVDGDTLRCGRERVRLVGLDTPEMQGRCAAETRMAERAKARLASLSAAGVTLQPQGRDRYDRLLAVVRDRAGRDLAFLMIREGHARPYSGGPRAGWC